MYKIYVRCLLIFSLVSHGMEFIDSEGRQFHLTQAQTATFGFTELGKQLQEDINQHTKVDFSGIRYRPLGYKGTNMLRLLSHVQDPSQLTLTDEVMPEEIQLLETANVLGLPNPACARHLAMRLWPVIQKNGPNPLRLIGWQKQGVRTLARPYVACPAQMLEHLKKNVDKNNINYLGILREWSTGRLNLSHVNCCRVRYYPKFGSLEGLEDLVRFLVDESFMLNKVNLDGHQLDTFSMRQIATLNYNQYANYMRTPLRSLSLRKNCISQLSEHQFNTTSLPIDQLDLTDNPISSMTDGAFAAINGHRAGYRIKYNFILSLERNLLNEVQKKELQKKFYNARHTIPERWTIGQNIATYKYVLALAPLLLLCVDPNFSEEPTIVRAAVTGLTLFWWWYLFVNRFDMRLAQLSHPTIGQSWGGDIHERSWAIWPENNAKLLL